jgi:hypothetical protein
VTCLLFMSQYFRIQWNSIVLETVVNRYCLMMALWAVTYSKIPLINSFYTGYVNEILMIVVLWWITKKISRGCCTATAVHTTIFMSFVTLRIKSSYFPKQHWARRFNQLGLEVPYLNLDWKINYPNWTDSLFFSIPPGKYQESTLS